MEFSEQIKENTEKIKELLEYVDYQTNEINKLRDEIDGLKYKVRVIDSSTGIDSR